MTAPPLCRRDVYGMRALVEVRRILGLALRDELPVGPIDPASLLALCRAGGGLGGGPSERGGDALQAK